MDSHYYTLSLLENGAKAPIVTIASEETNRCFLAFRNCHLGSLCDQIGVTMPSFNPVQNIESKIGTRLLGR